MERRKNSNSAQENARGSGRRKPAGAPHRSLHGRARADQAPRARTAARLQPAPRSSVASLAVTGTAVGEPSTCAQAALWRRAPRLRPHCGCFCCRPLAALLIDDQKQTDARSARASPPARVRPNRHRIFGRIRKRARARALAAARTPMLLGVGRSAGRSEAPFPPLPGPIKNIAGKKNRAPAWRLAGRGSPRGRVPGRAPFAPAIKRQGAPRRIFTLTLNIPTGTPPEVSPDPRAGSAPARRAGRPGRARATPHSPCTLRHTQRGAPPRAALAARVRAEQGTHPSPRGEAESFRTLNQSINRSKHSTRMLLLHAAAAAAAVLHPSKPASQAGRPSLLGIAVGVGARASARVLRRAAREFEMRLPLSLRMRRAAAAGFASVGRSCTHARRACAREPFGTLSD